MTFISHQRVRFGDCDGAGIAYYPRLLALTDAALEEWSEAALGIGRGETHLKRRLGTPTVELHVAFKQACRLGETLAFAVTPEHVGGASLRLGVAVTAAGEPRFDVTLTQVCMDLDAARAVPWPEEWRSRFLPLPRVGEGWGEGASAPIMADAEGSTPQPSPVTTGEGV